MRVTTVLCWVVLVCVLFVASAEATIAFKDDFEDGTLDAWTVGGRQLQGVSVAHVAGHEGTLVGYLFKTNLSEVSIEREFPYDPSLAFSFDMEAHSVSPFSASSADYAAGTATIRFEDKFGGFLGAVNYARTTSSWPVDRYNDDFSAYNPIADDLMHSYSLTMPDLVAQAPGVNADEITTVKLVFSAYSSGTYDALQATVYVDNVVVAPEPAFGVGLSLATIATLRRRRR